MASTQQNEFIQTLRPSRAAPPELSFARPKSLTDADADDDVIDESCSDGDEHEGGGGDGSAGWQWRPFQQRQSHFRPWIGQPDKKHRGGVASQRSKQQL